MDFSNYPKNHKLYNSSKKNALFHLKDETEGDKIIKKFIGLAPKQYAFSFLCKNGSKFEKKCHKGQTCRVDLSLFTKTWKGFVDFGK